MDHAGIAQNRRRLALVPELTAALQEMLDAFSLKTEYGPAHSERRLAAKKRAREILAKERKERP